MKDNRKPERGLRQYLGIMRRTEFSFVWLIGLLISVAGSLSVLGQGHVLEALATVFVGGFFMMAVSTLSLISKSRASTSIRRASSGGVEYWDGDRLIGTVSAKGSPGERLRSISQVARARGTKEGNWMVGVLALMIGAMFICILLMQARH